MSKLANTKYEEGRNMIEHLMRLMDIVTKLNKLKMPIDSTYLVYIALDCLPFEYMKSTYNTLKEDCTMDDLSSIVVLEMMTKSNKGSDVVNIQRSLRTRDCCQQRSGEAKLFYEEQQPTWCESYY